MSNTEEKAVKAVATTVVKHSIPVLLAAPIAAPVVTVITIGCGAKSIWDWFFD